MNNRIIGAALAALVGVALVQTAHADSQEANCEVRKDGDTQRGKSGPCTFGQRQGYIDIDLRNGDTISLSPAGGGGAGKYKDQKGNKVTRTTSANGMEFRWEGGKRLTVTWLGSGGNGGSYGGGYGTPATSSGMSAQRENAEWQRGFNDGLEGRYDQDNHPQPYKDGVRAGEEAARNNNGGGGGGGRHGDYFVNELDDGAFEVVWKSPSCFISYNANGYSTSTSQGCNNNQIQRSNEIARQRTR